MPSHSLQEEFRAYMEGQKNDNSHLATLGASPTGVVIEGRGSSTFF